MTIKERRLLRVWWFWVLVAVGIVVVGCGIAVLTDSLLYRNQIHAGISVHGVDLGGMTEERAAAALAQLVESSSGPVTLTSGGKTWSLTSADVGRTVDLQGTVARAMTESRRNNFFSDVVTRFKLYFESRDLPLDITVDRMKLEAVLGRIAAELHVAPHNARLTMNSGEVKVIGDVNGREVDTTALGAQVEALFVSLSSGTLEVPLIVKEPDVKVEANKAAEQLAQTMMSEPLTLTSHDETWTIVPQQIASWLYFLTVYRDDVPSFVPYLSEGRMLAFLDSLAAEVNHEPVEAGFKSVDGKPVVVPSATGETLDPTATVKALNAAAKSTGRTVEVAVTVTEPEFTTADAEATTFADELSSFTTKYWGSANRQVNVRITTQYATDVFLAPGEEYNFDEQIGPRTPKRGYLMAPGIDEHKKMVMQFGGGICQVSTTMFNAAFLAGLKVTERHNHSLYINHYPLGRDATVTGGGKNLRFVNDTGHHIWIRGISDGITTTLSIYGTSDGRQVTYTTRGSAGSYVKVMREVTLPDGTLLHNDKFVSVW
jgi:vancomycin resistance protein YoaR